MTERHNVRHWDNDKRGVYEVWYMTWNHPQTDQGFWLRYITEAPVDGPPRAELWFARFDPKNPSRTFGIHKRFAADQLTGSGIAFPRLAVQCLYAGEQTGGEPEPGQHAEKLHRVLPPMTEQRP